MIRFSSIRRIAAFVVTAHLSGLASQSLAADTAAESGTPSRCSPGESWDAGMNMCMPNPGANESGAVLAGHFNAFGVFSTLQGPRGVDQFAVPNWLMLDAGRRIDARQFINLGLMGTAELWTY